MSRYVPTLLLAMCGTSAALSTGAAEPSAQTLKAIREVENIQATLRALPARCTLRDAGNKPDHRIGSSDISTNAGAPCTHFYAFGKPIKSSGFHVALNAAGLHSLDKVEIRDARGTWSVVRTGAQAEAPPGCKFVRLTQAFATGKREVDALRITIRPGRDSIVVSDAGLTKAG